MKTDKVLGANVRDARLKAGITQEDLARRLRKTQPTISSWESGATSISAEMLARLARLLGVKVSDLYRGVMN